MDAELKSLPTEKQDAERRKCIDAWIDAGHGSRILRNPAIANMVQSSLPTFDSQRYRLLAWVVMPNHVHVLFQPMNGWNVAQIVASWKKFTTRKIYDVLRNTSDVCTPSSSSPCEMNPGCSPLNRSRISPHSIPFPRPSYTHTSDPAQTRGLFPRPHRASPPATLQQEGRCFPRTLRAARSGASIRRLEDGRVPCALLLLFAPRVFHNPFPIRTFHTLSQNCRGVTQQFRFWNSWKSSQKALCAHHAPHV
jgi:REP element-mobilizing transposase RayT